MTPPATVNKHLSRRNSRAPIVLGNAPSSGSSLLRVLLGRLPSVCTGGELAVLDKPDLLATCGRTYRRGIGRWLARGYPRGFVGPTEPLFTNVEEYGWSREGVRELCLAADSYSAMLHEFFRRTLAISKKSRWLEKTPGNVFAFTPIRELFPDAKFVHIVRDGRDAVASLARRGFSPLLAVGRWYYATLTGIQYRHWLNYYELRYEDLVARPREELTKLCRFLGEPFQESMLDGEVDRSSIVPSWRSNQHAPVSEASVGRHREALSTEQRAYFKAVRLSRRGRAALPIQAGASVDMSALELQAHLGYACDGLDGPAPLSAAAQWKAAKELARCQARSLLKFRRIAPTAIAYRSVA